MREDQKPSAVSVRDETKVSLLPAAGNAPTSSAADATAAGATVLSFPEPTGRRLRRRVLLAVAAIVVVLGVIVALAVYSPVLAVKTITVQGSKLVGERTLQQTLSPLLGKPLPQVGEADVSRLLAPLPQVASATMEARPPSTLVVRVVERVPVALLKSGGSYLLVDPSGVELGRTNDPATAALPLIDGGKAVIGKDTFAAMTAVLASLPASVRSRLAHASAKSPNAVELTLNDGKQVIWGDASQMTLKAEVLAALLKAPPPVGAPGEPDPPPVKVYDVSTPRHPVTR